MFNFNTYVPANEIWSTSPSHTDKGEKPGFVRGFNIEVIVSDGTRTWLSCEYIEGDPNEHFNDEFHLWYYNEHGWKPTGRITFRGYGIERYDYAERDTFIEPVEDDAV